jgi:hypothetical protein
MAVVYTIILVDDTVGLLLSALLITFSAARAINFSRR